MKKVLSIGANLILIIVVLKFVPLETVTEDYGSQSFTLQPYSTAATTLNVKKGWRVSGTFSESNSSLLTFTIYSGNVGGVIKYQTIGSPGTFSFTSDIDQSYVVTMANYITAGFFMIHTITVTLQAQQTGMTTLI